MAAIKAELRVQLHKAGCALNDKQTNSLIDDICKMELSSLEEFVEEGREKILKQLIHMDAPCKAFIRSIMTTESSTPNGDRSASGEQLLGVIAYIKQLEVQRLAKKPKQMAEEAGEEEECIGTKKRQVQSARLEAICGNMKSINEVGTALRQWRTFSIGKTKNCHPV